MVGMIQPRIMLRGVSQWSRPVYCRAKARNAGVPNMEPTTSTSNQNVRAAGVVEMRMNPFAPAQMTVVASINVSGVAQGADLRRQAKIPIVNAARAEMNKAVTRKPDELITAGSIQGEGIPFKPEYLSVWSRLVVQEQIDRSERGAMSGI